MTDMAPGEKASPVVQVFRRIRFNKEIAFKKPKELKDMLYRTREHNGDLTRALAAANETIEELLVVVQELSDQIEADDEAVA